MTEAHMTSRVGWIRAAVLGANDGLVSIASLVVGVAAADTSRSSLLVASIAGLSAGALSMAAGEYVSVSSQRDLEHADLAIEAVELLTRPRQELDELTELYERRGLDPDLARKVAEQLTAENPLDAHAREELGIDPRAPARPLQAAVVSASSFTVGALPPITVAVASSVTLRIPLAVLSALLGLLVLGVAGARLGGAPPRRAAVRVLAGGAFALGVSLLVGRVAGAAI